MRFIIYNAYMYHFCSECYNTCFFKKNYILLEILGKNAILVILFKHRLQLPHRYSLLFFKYGPIEHEFFFLLEYD